MVANRRERGCDRQHRECSRVDRISGRTNGRGKRIKSRSNTSVVPVSYNCRTKIVQAVMDRQRSGVKATIWRFCHDHVRSGRSAMIGNIGKEWSAQRDLGFTSLMQICVTWLQWIKGISHYTPMVLLCLYPSALSIGEVLSYRFRHEGYLQTLQNAYPCTRWIKFYYFKVL